jgi:hypothetical protein
MERKPIPPQVRAVQNIDNFAERTAAQKRMHAKSEQTKKAMREKAKAEEIERAERDEVFALINTERAAREPLPRDVIIDGDVLPNPDYHDEGQGDEET